MKTLFGSGRIGALLFLFTTGCVSFGERDQPPANSAPPASDSAVSHHPEDRLAKSINILSQSRTSADVSVHPISFTLPADEVAEGVPLEFLGTESDQSRAALTLAEIEQIALANNPAIAAAYSAAGKAAGLQNQVGVKPNPTVGFLAVQLADEGTDQHALFYEQEFVRGNKLQLNREVLRHTTNAQRMEASVQRHRLLTDLRVRFFEAAAAQQQLKVTESFSKVAGRGVEVARDRLEAEEASKVELLQAKILLSEIELAKEQYEAAYRGAWKDLVAIAGIPDSTPVMLADAFSSTHTAPDWDQKYAELLSMSPELAIAKELVCEKQAFLRRQKVQATPNLTAQFAAGFDNATDSGMMNLQFSAPIPVHNRNSGNISAAYADYTRALEDVTRIERSIRSRMVRVAQEYEAAIASVHKYEEEILPSAKESLELSEEAYEAGEFDFIQVLIVRRRYFDSMLAFIQSQGKLAQANAKIDGLLLSGGLDAPQDYTSGDGLRPQSFDGN